ncbi:MAG: hypothetical protein Q4A31_02105 [Corynebacterium sp.]|uniref:hypothetical protein n=1 Tax=Corynebacterium sp. TaxID=1720 RepID=UPI0026DCDC6C|nr:hypothetical protein [Corynebacterium sp.]MDO4760697.1 hypothetical protein [Corynebacterium sp.]
MGVESFTPRIPSGVSYGLLGAWLVSSVLLIFILSGVISKGEITALTMFAGASGILSSALLEKLVFKYWQKSVPYVILIVNAIILSAIIFFLGLRII